MLATHDQFTRQMRNRLKTTTMELGLVRLLQDAGLIEEARTTLYSLENGFQSVESAKPSQKPVNQVRQEQGIGLAGESFFELARPLATR